MGTLPRDAQCIRFLDLSSCAALTAGLSLPPHPHSRSASRAPTHTRQFGHSVCVIGNSTVIDVRSANSSWDYDSDDSTIDLAVGAPGDDTENEDSGETR